MNAAIIETFLQKPTEKSKIVVVYGPTACGKTNLSLDMAEFLGTEIISADSRQIYKRLNVGSGKIMPHEMRGIKHHMLDIADIQEHYSVALFVKAVQPVIVHLLAQNKIPVLCGGTGLYLDAVLYGLQTDDVWPNWKYRQELEALRQKKGNDFLWNMLFEKVPKYASTLHANNYRYVMRALELHKQNPQADVKPKTVRQSQYDTLFVTPYNDTNRTQLYKNINERVANMFAHGLVEETEQILQDGYKPTDFWLNTIGYKQTVAYLQGTISKAEAVEQVQQASRHYAKRQITWNKRYENGIIL